ncbi:hypothetical protein [Kineococcus sp. SYSU DK006]|uniref:hypothetical protein n=1 Tax=Kineococcus sp. SYSU DK006 TaxID=3383127 RepID=UPI003D7E9114
MAELQRLKATVLFTDDDVEALRLAGDVLADQVEAVLTRRNWSSACTRPGSSS